MQKRYKRNMINGDLSRPYRIGMEFESEKVKINEKFTKACFPVRFTNSVVARFEEKMVAIIMNFLSLSFFLKRQESLFCRKSHL